ncbi:MAG: hypothetical protein WC347_02455 [Smithellaceae bacterium]|jgi:hypothetical protein
MKLGNNWRFSSGEYWEMVKNEEKKCGSPINGAEEIGIFLNASSVPVFSMWQINPRHGRKIAASMGVSLNNLWQTSIKLLELGRRQK